MARADLAQNLRDPKVHARRFGEAFVTGAGTTVIAPGKMSPWARRGLHAASGLVGGGATAWVVGQQDDKAASRALPAAGAVGVLLTGASVVGSLLDTRAENWLAARGVKRPRVLLGVAAGLFTLAMLWVEDLTDAPDEPSDETADEPADDGAADTPEA